MYLVLLGLSLNSGCLLKRILTAPENPVTQVEWNQPKAPIAGQPGTPLPDGPVVLDAGVLEGAADWAEGHRSSGLLVLFRGQIQLERYWMGTDQTSFTESFSMAKSVAALAVGKAVDSGKIGSIDEPVSRYLPELETKGRGEITFRHLLEMTSGLRNEDQIEWGSDLLWMHGGRHLRRAALRIPALEPAGQRYDYNNANTQILTIALEEIYGEPYAEILSRELWKPLGLGDGAVYLDRKGGTAHGYASIFATLRDWGKMGEALRLGGAPIASPSWMAAMLTPTVHRADYGLHIWMAHNPADSDAWHDLDTFMFEGRSQQRVWVMPSAELVVVRVGERSEEWDNVVLPNMLGDAARAVQAAEQAASVVEEAP